MTKIWIAETSCTNEHYMLGAFDSEQKAHDAIIRFRDERSHHGFSTGTDENTEETMYSWVTDEKCYSGIVYPLILNKYR